MTTDEHTQFGDLIEHHPRCANPHPVRYVDPSDCSTGTKCRNCSRRVNHRDIVATRDGSAVAGRSSNYRCRDHHDEPVTWRGTGCAACERDRGKGKGKRSPVVEL